MSKEHAETQTGQHDIVDIEECARLGQRPPKAKRYKIRIDKTNHIVQVSSMTGKQLLELAGRKPVDQYKLFQKVRGGEPKPIGHDDVADFTTPGVEHYFTIKCDLREGRGERRDFDLPAPDVEFLESTSWTWDAIRDGNNLWLVVYDYGIPAGYNITSTTMGLLIPKSYPTTEIDMAYFSPSLSRVDGKAIPALANTKGAGFDWQRWSRHRHKDNPWRPGEDNLATHVCLVGAWLESELKR